MSTRGQMETVGVSAETGETGKVTGNVLALLPPIPKVVIVRL